MTVVKTNKIVELWQNRIIRTKILIGIFIGIVVYQGVTTLYQMQKVERDILETYKQKALNLSVVIDCIVLKDGILFFNMLDRIGRTEVVGVKIDNDHPSCVERDSYLKRVESSVLANYHKTNQPEKKKQSTGPERQGDRETTEAIEEIVEDQASALPITVPADLVFDSKKVEGLLQTTEIEMNGEKQVQILYTVKINGVELTFDLTGLTEQKLDKFTTLVLTALGNLLVLFVIIWVMSGRIVEPLKQLTQFTLDIMNSDAIEKGEPIDLVETPTKDEIGILARTFNKLIVSLQQSYRLIIKSKAAIGDLLNNTGQGFFSFGPDYLIHEEYSKACDTFFGHKVADLNALELMVPEKVDDVKELTDLLFNGVGDLNLLESLLPAEITLNRRILSVEYRFIAASSKEITDKMMVILTDITQKRKLEQQLEKDEALNELIVKIARDKEAFIQFVRDTDQLLLRILNETEHQTEPLEPTGLMRHFHTIKGVSASFGLHKLAEKSHQLEDRIQTAQRENTLDDAGAIAELGEGIKQMTEILTSSLDDLQNIVSKEEIDKNTVETYRVTEPKLVRLENLFAHTRKVTLKEVKTAIFELRKQPLEPVLKKFATTAANLAEKLGKQVDIKIIGADTEVFLKRMSPLFDSMIHLVRNSVDHGLERPETRVMLEKPETGRLRLESSRRDGKLELIIADDGKGIDPEMVKNSALQKKIITPDHAEKLTEAQAVNLIFMPGFSTSEAVTDLSGRGVGLDAVKTAVKELGGTITIKTRKEKGTRFIIAIPETVTDRAAA